MFKNVGDRVRTPRRLNPGLNFEACGGADGKKSRGHTETQIEFSHGLLDFCTGAAA